jgi:hypothetical protein
MFRNVFFDELRKKRFAPFFDKLVKNVAKNVFYLITLIKKMVRNIFLMN